VENPSSDIDWIDVRESLIANGSVYVHRAVGGEVARRLIAGMRLPWHVLPAQEGVVWQNGSAGYGSMIEAEPLVRSVGADIVRNLETVALPGLPAIPDFNEVSWTRYPAKIGHITAHRDPAAYGGIIAVATLLGEATFRVWPGVVQGKTPEVLAGDARPAEWTVAAGDLILLRGNGWPTPNARCPIHEVDPPSESERMIMTFRFNTRGAGGGYDV
jgi:hypothetical protein